MLSAETTQKKLHRLFDIGFELGEKYTKGMPFYSWEQFRIDTSELFTERDKLVAELLTNQNPTGAK